MRRHNSGVMVSFTVGFIAGLCATHEESRQWLAQRAHRALKLRTRRHLINIIDTEEIS